MAENLQNDKKMMKDSDTQIFKNATKPKAGHTHTTDENQRENLEDVQKKDVLLSKDKRYS